MTDGPATPSAAPGDTPRDTPGAVSGATPDAVGDLVCSARRCRADAVWGVLWNNPKLHTPERRKVWLACAEHREYLEDYLRVRGFLRGVVPVTELEQAAP